jgi:hypothetical protein
LSEWFALGLAVFALGGAGLVAAMLRPNRPVSTQSIVPAVQYDFRALFAAPPAVYGTRPQGEESVVKPEESNMSDENAEKAIIRLQERYSSQEVQLQRLERLIEAGQKQSSEALKELAKAFNDAFAKASAEFVTKQEFQTVKNIVNGAAAAILLGFLGFLLAQAWPQ